MDMLHCLPCKTTHFLYIFLRILSTETTKAVQGENRWNWKIKIGPKDFWALSYEVQIHSTLSAWDDDGLVQLGLLVIHATTIFKLILIFGLDLNYFGLFQTWIGDSYSK